MPTQHNTTTTKRITRERVSLRWINKQTAKGIAAEANARAAALTSVSNMIAATNAIDVRTNATRKLCTQPSESTPLAGPKFVSGTTACWGSNLAIQQSM